MSPRQLHFHYEISIHHEPKQEAGWRERFAAVKDGNTQAGRVSGF